MAKRFMICPIIGTGVSTQDAFRAAINSIQGVAYKDLIPTIGPLTKFNFAFAVFATAERFLEVTQVSNSFVFPDYPLDARMDGMAPDVRAAMVQSAEAFVMNADNFHLDLSHDDSDSYRDLITSIGMQIEPAFNINIFDVAEAD